MRLTSPGFSYSEAQFESVVCNFCGLEEDFKVLTRRDRNNLSIQLCLCPQCGLMFLNPRMTGAWYEKYYQVEYRAQLERLNIKESSTDLNVAFERAKKMGRALYQLFAPYLIDGLTIDVGSGVGGILKSFSELNPGLEVIGIEPSKPEAEYAKQKGIPTLPCLFEELSSDFPPAANIMSMRNLNHLLNPRKFLSWAYDHLREDGNLILTVQNFRHATKERGKVISQIDHCYYFVPETLRPFVESAGFDVILMDKIEDKSLSEISRLKDMGLPASMKVVARKKLGRTPFSKICFDAEAQSRILESFNPKELRKYRVRYLVHQVAKKIKKTLKRKFKAHEKTSV